jgi:protein O-GlcNAc transferase
MPNPQHELRRAGAALGAGDARAASRICQKLLTANPRDVEARHLHGRCLAGLGRIRDAAAEFRRALTIHHSFFPALVDLGITETLDGQYTEALDVLERARTLDSRPAELHFGLGLCHLGFQDYAAAISAFRAAIERNSRFPDAYNNLGVAHDRLGQLTEARDCFQQAAAIHAGYTDAHRNLGDVLRRLQDAQGAVAAFQRVAQLTPHDPSAHVELGLAQLAAEDFAAASSSLEQALSLNPTNAGAAAHLGDALLKLGLAERADAAYRQALQLDPHQARPHIGLGKLAAELGDDSAVIHHLRAAAGSAPNDSGMARELAAELESLGASADALIVLRRSAQGQMGDPDLQDALGALLHRLGRLPEALDCYERSLEIDDGRATTYLNCGHALESMGALSRAVECFERARTLEPAAARPVASIASCAFRLCDWDLEDQMLSTLRAIPNGIDELQAFLLLASDFDPTEIAQSLTRRARLTSEPGPFARRRPEFTSSRAPRAGEPLRVAYVSPDFRIHPVAYAIAGVIERHDRTRIAPIGVSLRPSDGSALGARLEGAFEEYIDASALSDRDVVKLLRERHIDVAIDLAGLTAESRTGIFALRAAPVQINYLGFPGSMGMDFMDYLIADPLVVPQADDVHYSEKVLRMPHSYLPFDDTRDFAIAGGREAAGLPPEGFVFCAFNNGYKITRPMFAIWMSLLRDVPGSVLWLRSMGSMTVANLRRAASTFGIAADRLVFAPVEERMESHLARLQLADLFLDTLPYNAHTTAAEALWCGVPVVTCLGKAFAGRVGASLLSACDLADLICPDLDSYRRRALQVARSPSLQFELRERLRQNKRSSPVFDTRRYTQDLEQLLIQAGGGTAGREP